MEFELVEIAMLLWQRVPKFKAFSSTQRPFLLWAGGERLPPDLPNSSKSPL